LESSKVLELVESVIRVPSVDLLALSENGRFALVLSNVSGSNQLWSADVATGKMKQVSHGDQRAILAEISPDSKTFVFTRDFEGAERHQFFLAPITGTKEEVQVSDLGDIRVYNFSWSPDGREIVFCGSTSKAHHLWTLEPGTRRHRELYTNRGSIFSPDYSRDGSRIAVSAKTTEEPRSSEILVISRKTGEVNIYSPKRGSENVGAKWHPREQKLLFETNVGGNYDLAVHDFPRQKLTYLGLSPLARDFASFGWARKGEAIWFVALKNGRTKLYFKNGNGKPRLVRTPTGRISSAKLSKDGSFLVFSWSSLSTPPQLAKLDLRKRKTSVLYSPKLDERLPLGKAEFLAYPSVDGLRIPAYMLFSSGSRRPGPVVVWPHGGPSSDVSDEWNPAIQAICMAGFHVFCPNFRGSTGYGAQFERMNIGDAGGRDLQDVVAGAKLVKDRGYVEGDKIGIAGASYGGYLTYLGMTKVPDIWRAGVAIAGVPDRKEQYDLSDAAWREFLVQLLGRPEENAALYRDRSAINFVSQIKAPILIWHRANDSRCPVQPVKKFADQLKALGKEYELNIVEDEGHGPQRTDNLVKQYKGVVSFLLKNLA
jgi:dipeptidyl aminopeptidase/acylaminoacyl peptidase